MFVKIQLPKITFKESSVAKVQNNVGKFCTKNNTCSLQYAKVHVENKQGKCRVMRKGICISVADTLIPVFFYMYTGTAMLY